MPATKEEILAFKTPCPLKKMQVTVGALTCRVCSEKRTCPQIQELLGSEREYLQKFKGTILESAMKRVGSSRRDIGTFILEGRSLEP